MSFSERYGYVQVRSAVQVEELDESTRRAIWNLLHLKFFNHWDSSSPNRVDAVFLPLWLRVFQRPADEYPGARYISPELKTFLAKREWFLVYDLVECVCHLEPALIRPMNRQLERFKAGYRLLNGQIVPISDTNELSEIEAAIGSENEGTAHHLQRALELLANRENPDYVNSIKESISAVESKAGQLTGKTTLGKALDEMKKNGPYLHPSLIEGWKKIYGWTSDEDGVRHGGATAPTQDQDLARYMLVTCSAFVNLLTAAQALQTDTP